MNALVVLFLLTVAPASLVASCTSTPALANGLATLFTAGCVALRVELHRFKPALTLTHKETTSCMP